VVDIKRPAVVEGWGAGVILFFPGIDTSCRQAAAPMKSQGCGCGCDREGKDRLLHQGDVWSKVIG
jgi:hypothetical protein